MHPLSNLAQGGVNIGHHGRLGLTATANVGESCNKVIATMKFFDQDGQVKVLSENVDVLRASENTQSFKLVKLLLEIL